jgi:hypothetical protein
MSDFDDIEGKYGGISGKYGGISGKYGGLSGKYGGISGESMEGIEQVVFEGRLIDEISHLAIKIRRLETDLMGIASAFDTRLANLEERMRGGGNKLPPPPQKPGDTKPNS